MGNNQIEEESKLEKTDLPCPICGSPLYLTKTKRTFAWKCIEGCKQFDSNKLTDIFSHRRRELEALPFLKKMCPHLTFVENISYGWDYLLEDISEIKQRMIYDAKVFFCGNKLERIKISVIQNCNFDRYMETEEQYLQGRKNVMEKLAGMDAVFVLFFVDEPDESKKIAVGLCREILRFANEVTDRFNNQQYSLPKEYRRLLLTNDKKRISELLHRNLFRKLFEKRYVI